MSSNQCRDTGVWRLEAWGSSSRITFSGLKPPKVIIWAYISCSTARSFASSSEIMKIPIWPQIHFNLKRTAPRPHILFALEESCQDLKAVVSDYWPWQCPRGGFKFPHGTRHLKRILDLAEDGTNLLELPLAKAGKRTS